MRFDVSELLKAPTGESRTYQIEGWELDVVDSAGRDLVNGSVALMRTQAGVLASAHASLHAQDVCSRCLRQVNIPLDLDFQEEFLPTADILTGAALPPPEDPGTFLIDAQQTLDLSEALHQYRETALPMQPLCRPDCAGLCPTCGRELNSGRCECARAPVDARWSALAELGRRLQDR